MRTCRFPVLEPLAIAGGFGPFLPPAAAALDTVGGGDGYMSRYFALGDLRIRQLDNTDSKPVTG